MPSVVAIGVFDGVHLGHQAVLRSVRTSARAQGFAALALTFDPHPAAYFAPERAPRLLCSLSQRIEHMETPGLADEAELTPIVASFNESFAALTAREFVENVLVDQLQAHEVWVGADFRFGRGRQGGVMELESMGERLGFSVKVARAVSSGGDRISSSWIRSLVERGDVKGASALLDYPFTLRGTVVRGKQLGRTIGYPTANLQPEEPLQLLPANGIYGGFAHFESSAALSGGAYAAAASVGTNPTTDGINTVRKVEAYLLTQQGIDVYGVNFDLSFVERIRDERHFDGLGPLVKQIEDDVRQIAALLSIDITGASQRPTAHAES